MLNSFTWSDRQKDLKKRRIIPDKINQDKIKVRKRIEDMKDKKELNSLIDEEWKL